MSSRNLLDNSHEIGQVKLIREEYANQASDISQQVGQSGGHNTSISSQASNFIHQTGEQVKNMAEGAANVMKNTLGMKAADDHSITSSTKNTTTAPLTHSSSSSL